MFRKKDFFGNFSFKSQKFNKNLKEAKKVLNLLESDIKNYNIPLLESYKKEYQFDFSQATINKFYKYKNIIIVGMGGSILGAKTIYSFLKKKIKKEVFFFDNLDENLHINFNKIKNLKNSCFIIVSKSGNTLETITNFGIFFSKSLLKNKLIIITETQDNALSNIANKLNAEIIEHKDFIGGRYSVLSEVGMFPAALMGLDIYQFKNLAQLIKNKNFASCLIKNVASIYTLNLEGKKNSIFLNYDSSLNNLAYWYQQLSCESLGKKGHGITVNLSPVPRDHHSLLQLYLDGPKDKFFTFFNSSSKKDKFIVSQKAIPNSMKFLKNKKLGSIIKAQSNATKKIFSANKIPFRQFTFNKNNEKELGIIFTFFVLETILLARLMKINPFDQPAVEMVKIETRKILSK